MPNPEHLAILKEGVERWNAWREAHPDVRPDLEEADLSKADLIRADLARANLTGANLRGADLRNADLLAAYLKKADLLAVNLTSANLQFAVLFGANLQIANLRNANLRGAKLDGANLRGADLIEVILYEADLKGATFVEAFFASTTFADTNLTKAKGLDQSYYLGPSTIDHRTLAKSGDLPIEFLRGCGLPQSYIDYLPSLLGKPYEFYTCFISYSSKDDEFARCLHADLRANSVECWFAPENLKIGDRIRPVIHDAIRLHDKLLLILSEDSVHSQWVEDEVERALEKERRDKTTVLFPIRLDDSVMDIDEGWATYLKNTRHIGDFTDWKDHDAYQQSFDRLLRDLKA